MKVHQFDIESGIYHFELQELETGFHAHPAVEIIFSDNNNIDLETAQVCFKNLSFAIIAPSLPHKVTSGKGTVSCLMIESNSSYLQMVLKGLDLPLSDGLYISSDQKNTRFLIKEIVKSYEYSKFPFTLNQKVQEALRYLNSSNADYKKMLKVLKMKTNLSSSRLSHLFKEEMGISIKKYLVWSKLKRAFQKVVHENKNMYKASIESGFYDQAHLIKGFKQMFGVSPSYAYNSRMLQVFEEG